MVRQSSQLSLISNDNAPTRLKMVILDSAYGARNHPRTAQFFWEMVRLKMEGYRTTYRDGILAVGDSDFIAIHKLICEERNGQLIPLLGNQTVTVDRAAYHNIAFPALALAEASGSKAHVEYVRTTMERCKREGRILAYDGGFTINPEARLDHAKSKQLHELFAAMKTHFLLQYGIHESFTASTVRFKVEKTCHFWGYKAVEMDGNRLQDIPVPRFDREMVTLMHMKQLDPKTIELANQYRTMWNERIIVEGRETAEQQQKKAA